MVVFAISNLLRKVVNSKLVLANIAVLIVAFVLQSYHPITSILEKHRVQLLDNIPNWNATHVTKLWTTIGEPGCLAYQSMYPWMDLAASTSFFVLLVQFLTALWEPGSLFSLANLIPIGAIIADFVENYYVGLVLETCPETTAQEAATISEIGGRVTSAKIGFAFLSVMLLFLGASRWVTMRSVSQDDHSTQGEEPQQSAETASSLREREKAE